MTPLIRELERDDNDAVRALVLRILNQEYAMALTLDELPDLVDVHATYRVATGGNFWVACVDGGIAGCIGVWPLADADHELRRMYVDAAHRGQGIAQRLLEVALDWCARHGVRQLWLETNVQWQAARHLYEKHGFVPATRDELPAAFPVVRVATGFYRRPIHSGARRA